MWKDELVLRDVILTTMASGEKDEVDGILKHSNHDSLIIKERGNGTYGGQHRWKETWDYKESHLALTKQTPKLSVIQCGADFIRASTT